MTRSVAILTDDPGWHGRRLENAFGSRGCRVVLASLRDCAIELDPVPAVRIPGLGARLPHAAFVRGVPGGTLDEVVFHLDVLHALEALGVPVYNDGRAIERSVDKCMTTLLMAQAGIPTPATWVCTGPRMAWQRMLTEQRAGRELVCKPLFGSQGEGVVRVGTGTPLPDPDGYSGVYYLQRYIDAGEGRWRDWRVLVVANRAVAAMRREGGGWVNNVARGARCFAEPLDRELAGLAEAAARATGMQYAGVDIIRDRRGAPWVIEVNGVPAWKGLQSVCDVDIAATLVDDLLGKAVPLDPAATREESGGVGAGAIPHGAAPVPTAGSLSALQAGAPAGPGCCTGSARPGHATSSSSGSSGDA